MLALKLNKNKQKKQAKYYASDDLQLQIPAAVIHASPTIFLMKSQLNLLATHLEF